MPPCGGINPESVRRTGPGLQRFISQLQLILVAGDHQPRFYTFRKRVQKEAARLGLASLYCLGHTLREIKQRLGQLFGRELFRDILVDQAIARHHEQG